MAGRWQLGVLLLLLSGWAQAREEEEAMFSTSYSEEFELRPGDVTDSFYRIVFPQGHIAVREFDAEVVDEKGRSVPLNDLYLHHWTVGRLHMKKGRDFVTAEQFRSGSLNDKTSDAYLYEDVGLCKGSSGQWIGRGSETRKSNTYIPAPYGMVIGDPAVIPDGYEEVWYLNVHGIDTRDAISTKNCIECLCDAYNVTLDKNGRALKQGYSGGLYCCYDKTHCAVKPESNGGVRRMSLKYTIRYVPYTDAIKPVRQYTIDVTDQRNSLSEEPNCKTEYDVEQCEGGGPKCVHRMSTVAGIHIGGDVVQMLGHQHAGGLGMVIRREDGTPICDSRPIYGVGDTVGNEAGYVVGMTTCRPEIGTAYIKSMELLRATSYYSSSESHTGVMGLMFVVIADPIIVAENSGLEESEGFMFCKAGSAALAVFAAGVVVALSLSFKRYMKSKRIDSGYEVLMNKETA